MPQEVRRRPSFKVQARLLDQYRYRCAYCTHPFGTLVYRGASERLTTLEWDHLVPYALAGRNHEDNWVSACNVCNGIKSDHVYADLTEARDAILTRWTEKGYSAVWVPHTSSEDDPDRWAAEYAEREIRAAPRHRRPAPLAKDARVRSSKRLKKLKPVPFAKDTRPIVSCPTCGEKFKRWSQRVYCQYDCRPSAYRSRRKSAA